MADTISYRFRLRRRTAAEWTSVNEILLSSEIGHESDTGFLKIGDGITAWNNLAYFGNDSGVLRPAGNTYTLAMTDNGKTILSNDAFGFTLQIPTDAAIPFPIGTKIAYTQGAAGPITVQAVTPGTTTVHAPNGNTTGAQWDGGVVEKIGANEWQIWNGPSLGPLATADDAPRDGKTYGRNNGDWAVAGSATSINEQVGTAYSLVATDATKAVRCSNAAAITLTVPLNSAINLPLLCTIPIIQGGAGAVTIAAAAGVTLEIPNGNATGGQGDFRVLFQRALDIWVVA